MNLQDKKILLISPSFFGYEKEIVKYLKQLGACVDYFDQRPANTFWVKGLIRVNRNLLKPLIKRYYNNILLKLSGVSYDYVLVIDGETLMPSILKKLRQQFASAKFILYIWDSLHNRKNAKDLLPFFDKKYSFDKGDSVLLEDVSFLPLFYLNEYMQIPSKPNFEYDFSFIGTAHSDRYDFLKKMKQQAQHLNLTTFFYLFLHNYRLFLWLKLTNPSFRRSKMNDFNYSPMSRADVLEVFSRSCAIVDVHHPKQTGLTMRTIETLGVKRKLITTNAAIKHYDFYDPNNVLVIDRLDPQLPRDFFNTPYHDIPSEIHQRYSLESWIQEILGGA